MTCPGCQAELRVRTVAGIAIDECAGCGAFWFDGGELAQYRARLERRPPAEIAAFETTPASQSTACPRCRVLTLQSGSSGSLDMQACRNCRGVFLSRDVVASLGGVKTSRFESAESDPFEFVVGEDLLDLVIEIATAIW